MNAKWRQNDVDMIRGGEDTSRVRANTGGYKGVTLKQGQVHGQVGFPEPRRLRLLGT